MAIEVGVVRKLARSTVVFGMGMPLLAAVTLLVLQGCGKKQQAVDNFGDDYSHPYSFQAESEARAKYLASNAEVTCDRPDSTECLPAVGMLVTWTASTQVGQCTASLVDSHTIVTNTHCVPADLRKSGASCAGRAWMYFPTLPGLAAEKVGCSSIVSTTPFDANRLTAPDVAFISLDREVSRPALPLVRDGFENEQFYSIIKMNPQKRDAAVGVIQRVSCRALFDSVLTPPSDRLLPSSLLFGDCEVLHGNSGSPILDSRGRMRGVIQLQYFSDKIEQVLRPLRELMLDSELTKFSGGTSFACLELPMGLIDAPRPLECDLASNVSNRAQKREEETLTALTQKLEDVRNQHSAQQGRNFSWNFSAYRPEARGYSYTSPTQSEAKAFVVVPECIQDPDGLLVNQQRGNKTYAAEASLFVKLPIIRFRTGVDRYLVPNFRVMSTDSAYMTIRYSPASVAASQETRVIVSETNVYGATRTIMSGTLARCKSESAAAQIRK